MNIMRPIQCADAKLDRRLGVTMLGLRGFPNVQGGVESHVQHLSCALADLGCEVEVVMRSPYVAAGIRDWRGVRLVPLWAPRVPAVEALVHTFLGVLRAAWTRPDILHIHAIGPALFAPLGRVMGLRVVVTHHSANYENPKWSRAGRAILRLGEWAGMACAHARICVSKFIAERVQRSFRVEVSLIPNGVHPPAVPSEQSLLGELGLSPCRYVLSVGRIDPQKCQTDLIAAFARARVSDWKLVLVGAADYATRYQQAVTEAASCVGGVIMLGYQSPAVLAQLYAHAAAFVLPSLEEGHPIALLEALSHGLPAIVTDIPGFREVVSPSITHVPVHDVDALAGSLRGLFAEPTARRMDTAEREQFSRRYDWNAIAEATLGVYLDALKKVPPRRPFTAASGAALPPS